MNRILPLVILLLAPLVALAYPPAPHHTIYGMARDEWGSPLRDGATITFTTDQGVTLSTPIIPGLEPGVNYRLLIPMDSGTAPDLYRPTAQRSSVPFRIEVKIGTATYLPIEMQGDFSELGEPAKETHLNLTLGSDSDDDGLPDAWKDMVIAMMGGGLTRADIRPDDDLDGDGMTNMQEYIAGTYPWDPADRLWLEIIKVREEAIVLEFFAIDGRTYQIWGTNDFQEWAPVRFRLPAVDAPGASRLNYFAPNVRQHEVEVVRDEQPDAKKFFRLQVQ